MGGVPSERKFKGLHRQTAVSNIAVAGGNVKHYGKIDIVKNTAFSHRHFRAVGLFRRSSYKTHFPREIAQCFSKPHSTQGRDNTVHVMAASVPYLRKRVILRKKGNNRAGTILLNRVKGRLYPGIGMLHLKPVRLHYFHQSRAGLILF